MQLRFVILTFSEYSYLNFSTLNVQDKKAFDFILSKRGSDRPRFFSLDPNINKKRELTLSLSLSNNLKQTYHNEIDGFKIPCIFEIKISIYENFPFMGLCTKKLCLVMETVRTSGITGRGIKILWMSYEDI